MTNSTKKSIRYKTEANLRLEGLPTTNLTNPVFAAVPTTDENKNKTLQPKNLNHIVTDNRLKKKDRYKKEADSRLQTLLESPGNNPSIEKTVKMIRPVTVDNHDLQPTHTIPAPIQNPAPVNKTISNENTTMYMKPLKSPKRFYLKRFTRTINNRLEEFALRNRNPTKTEINKIAKILKMKSDDAKQWLRMRKQHLENRSKVLNYAERYDDKIKRGELTDEYNGIDLLLWTHEVLSKDD